MGRAADGVFRDGEPREEAPGYAIVFRALGCDILASAFQFQEQRLIRCHATYFFLVGKNTDEIVSQERFDGANSEGRFHVVRDWNFALRADGKIHLVLHSLSLDG